jgi:outer membrane lipoprotein carrier protein
LELAIAVALTGVLLAAGPLPATPAITPDELARRVEERHRNLRDLTATFVQTYKSGALGREVKESGLLSLKNPGRMLWEYQDPEKKTFVSNGKSFYFYVPADKQVIVREQADLRGIAALLLSGRGDILSQFQVSLPQVTGTSGGLPQVTGRSGGAQDPPKGRDRLRLVPRKKDAEVEEVILDVDASARIVSIEVLDGQGNRSHFDFARVRENVGLKDQIFEFKVPRGVEVITG